ncbi:RNA-directed DNA polymerase, eukaryota, partial [Tanacetum coccineum]
KIIDDKSLSDVDSKTRWIKYVPIKVNVHAWKVKTDCLPTRFNVSRRGIDIDSIMCAICDNGVETSRHLFFYCCMVRQIVRKITRYWDVPYVHAESYEDWYRCNASFSWVTLGKLLPHARGLGFEPHREGFSSGAKNEWGLSSKENVRVLHTAQLDVTVSSNH